MLCVTGCCYLNHIRFLLYDTFFVILLVKPFLSESFSIRILIELYSSIVEVKGFLEMKPPHLARLVYTRLDTLWRITAAHAYNMLLLESHCMSCIHTLSPIVLA